MRIVSVTKKPDILYKSIILLRQIARHRTNQVLVFNREIPNRSNLWNISEWHIYMKCLSILWSIFKGHEHILGDKIAKFEATLRLQRRIYSSICFYQTYAIDIVIRHVRDRDYNTSKANKPISYNLI
jgi:hypothetical protein